MRHKDPVTYLVTYRVVQTHRVRVPARSAAEAVREAKFNRTDLQRTVYSAPGDRAVEVNA